MVKDARTRRRVSGADSDWLGVMENYGQGRQDEKEGQRCRQRLARG